MSLSSCKAELRSELRERAATVDPERLAACDEALAARVRNLPEWKDARGLAAYASMPGEPSTDGLLQSFLARGDRVACLRYDADAAVYRPVRIRDVAADLEVGRFGIREPDGPPLASPRELDLALLPGLGFDRGGRRIGRGRGYIDEFCAWLGSRPTRVALAFSWQIVDEVPVGPRDEVMDVVITELETIRVAPGRRLGGREAAIGG